MAAIDTITQTTNVIHDTIFVRSVDVVNISKDVHDFYQTSWSNLLWVLSIAFTVIGGAIPLVTYLFQRRSYKKIKRKLAAQINEITKLKSETTTSLNSLEVRVRANMEVLEEDIKETLSKSTKETESKVSDSIVKTQTKVDSMINVVYSNIYLQMGEMLIEQNHSILALKNAVSSFHYITRAVNCKSSPAFYYGNNIKKVLLFIDEKILVGDISASHGPALEKMSNSLKTTWSQLPETYHGDHDANKIYDRIIAKLNNHK